MTLDRAGRVLARLQRSRRAVLAVYTLLVPVAVWGALHIRTEGALDRLIAPSDPDYAATRSFQELFPEPQVVLFVFESPDPWAPGAIARVDRARAAIASVPHVGAFDALDAIRRVRPGATPAELRRLATGARLFRDQGLVGDHHLAIVASIDAHSPDERDRALDALHASLASEAPYHAVGSPVVASWLERESASATPRSFAVFGVLLVGVALVLYRSFRALAAIAISLGAAVALAVAVGGLFGFSFTIVSALVPLTVMVTTLASLTYIHSRFLDQPAGVALLPHQLAALRNKLLPVTASTIAAAAGFAALAVSDIQPIREMGLWVAAGLVLAWLVAFTLFPALQLTLATPTGLRVAPRDRTYERVANALPRVTRRLRWPIAIAALALSTGGVIAVFGLPGVVPAMPLEVDTLSNLDPGSAVARDLVWFREHVTDINVARVWIHLPRAAAMDTDVLHAVDRFETALARAPNVTGVTGPTTPLRMRSYFAGHGEAMPSDPQQFADATADVEQLALTEPDFRSFIDLDGMQDMQVTVLFRGGDAAGYAALSARIAAAWRDVAASSPAVTGTSIHVVGEAVLQVKVGANLVPTLAESFLLTAALVLVVFVAVFRSARERALAMVPSLFALLVVFFGMRLCGATLNVATVIIATTVLGTTENDQLHFFHHMHERAGAPLEDRLRHTLHVVGRAVVFATAINACGFAGLAVSHFPPLRQFGVVTAAAFVLALLGDLVVLPAVLWLALARRSGSREHVTG